MAMNMRVSKDDPRFTNPGRDVAHCFDKVIKTAGDIIKWRKWGPIEAYLDEHKVTDEEIDNAFQAMVDFVTGTCDDPKEGMFELLTRVGWFGVREEAQVVVCAVIGQVMTGFFFQGAREVTRGYDGPVADMQYLKKSGRQAHKWLSMPRWRRWLARLFKRKGTNGGSSKKT